MNQHVRAQTMLARRSELQAADQAWLQRHLNGCETCAARAQAYARQSSLLQTIPTPEPPAHLQHAVLSRARLEPIPTRRNVRGAWLVAPASLAALLLLTWVLARPHSAARHVALPTPVQRTALPTPAGPSTVAPRAMPPVVAHRAGATHKKTARVVALAPAPTALVVYPTSVPTPAPLAPLPLRAPTMVVRYGAGPKVPAARSLASSSPKVRAGTPKSSAPTRNTPVPVATQRATPRATPINAPSASTGSSGEAVSVAPSPTPFPVGPEPAIAAPVVPALRLPPSIPPPPIVAPTPNLTPIP